MGTPYIGEIRMFGGNFAPAGWAFCDGSLVSISENETLFVLIGTTYGGDGQETFALPDLRGRAPLHRGQGPGLGNYIIGQQSGVESVTLTLSQMPFHNHILIAANVAATDTTPSSDLVPAITVANVYDVGPDTPMNPAIMPSVGSSQAHDNMQPTIAVNFIISLFGIFPTS